MQQAAMPALDALAKRGINGLVDPVEPGLACGSDTAHMSLLGYAPHEYYRGRGAFETMGCGLAMRTGDIAFKCIFSHIVRQEEKEKKSSSGSGEQKKIDDDGGVWVAKARRCCRDFASWGSALCADLCAEPIRVPGYEHVQVAIRYATEHRCGIRLRIDNDDDKNSKQHSFNRLSDHITDTDPLRDNLPLRRCEATKAYAHDEASRRTAELVNRLAALLQRRLEQHPLIIKRRGDSTATFCNALLFRGAASRVELPSFEERHALRAFMIAPTCIIRGLGISLGMHTFVPPGTTGDEHSLLGNKVNCAVRLLQQKRQNDDDEYDFGFLHIKCVDEAGHAGNWTHKRELLERVDRVVIAPLVARLRGQRVTMIVTGDHSTPCSRGDHSNEPVPLVLARLYDDDRDDPRALLFRADQCTAFDEVQAARGILGRFPGAELMPLILRLI
jgi:2,3-diphosphopglycerate-independent phosphoglycerate mutase